MNICQGSCKFCPYQTLRSGEEPNYLDYDVYKCMISEISKYNVERLTLFNNNEPLIDKRIYDFIKYARENLGDIEITLSSNGILTWATESFNSTFNFSLLVFHSKSLVHR